MCEAPTRKLNDFKILAKTLIVGKLLDTNFIIINMKYMCDTHTQRTNNSSNTTVIALILLKIQY